MKTAKALGMVAVSLALFAAGQYIKPGIVSDIALVAAGGFLWFGVQQWFK